MMKNVFHEFIPDNDELIYKVYYDEDNKGNSRGHLINESYQGRKVRGIFIHSGSKVKIKLCCDDIIKIKFKCLMRQGVIDKSSDQIFQINTVEGDTLFQYCNKKENRVYEDPEFELLLASSVMLPSQSVRPL